MRMQLTANGAGTEIEMLTDARVLGKLGDFGQPVIRKKAEQFIRRHIKRHQKVMHMKHSQAVAVALHEARDKGYKIPPKKKRRLL